MGIEVTEVGVCRYKVAVTVPVAEVEAQYKTALGQLSLQVPVKGFRRGHVPDSFLMRRYGKELTGDVSYKLFEQNLAEALKSKGLRALGTPDIEVETLRADRGQEFAFATEIDVCPQVALPPYSEIKLTAPELVTDADIGIESERLRRAANEDLPENEPAQAGFVLRISGTINDPATDAVLEKFNYTALALIENENAGHIAAGVLLPDLINNFVGVKVGDKKEITVTTNQEFTREEYRDKPVLAKLEVVQISANQPLPIADFISRFGAMYQVSTEEEFIAKIRDTITRRRANETAAANGKEVLKYLVENVPFDLPADYVKRQTEQILSQKLAQERAHHHQPDDAAEHPDETALRAEAEKDANLWVREAIVLDILADKEKVFVTEEDLQNYVVALSRTYQIPLAELVRKLHDQRFAMAATRDIISNKVLKIVVNKINSESENSVAPVAPATSENEGK